MVALSSRLAPHDYAFSRCHCSTVVFTTPYTSSIKLVGRFSIFPMRGEPTASAFYLFLLKLTHPVFLVVPSPCVFPRLVPTLVPESWPRMRRLFSARTTILLTLAFANRYTHLSGLP